MLANLTMKPMNSEITDEFGKLLIKYCYDSGMKSIDFYLDVLENGNINELNKIQKDEFSSTQMTNYQAQFQWFLGMAFFLLLLDVFFLERKTAWVKKADLFNEK